MEKYKEFIFDYVGKVGILGKDYAVRILEFLSDKWDEDTLGIRCKTRQISSFCSQHAYVTAGVSTVGVFLTLVVLVRRRPRKKMEQAQEDEREKKEFDDLVDILKQEESGRLDTSLHSRKGPMESIAEMSQQENEDRIFFEVMNNYCRS